MLLGILSISLGSSLIAREEKEGTIELLLSRPLSRTKLLLGKVKAGLVILITVSACALLITVILGKMVKLVVPSKNIALATIASFMLALSFGAVAFLVTMFGRARIASIGIAALYALSGYMLASLVGTVHWLKYPAKLFPYNYYKPAEILNGTYNWNNMIFIVGVIVLCGIASLIIFRKRDLTS
jgi:ABC-2 type transport system permease protein